MCWAGTTAANSADRDRPLHLLADPQAAVGLERPERWIELGRGHEQPDEPSLDQISSIELADPEPGRLLLDDDAVLKHQVTRGQGHCTLDTAEASDRAHCLATTRPRRADRSGLRRRRTRKYARLIGGASNSAESAWHDVRWLLLPSVDHL